MFISEIIGSKGSTVVTLSETESLETAAQILDEKRIGAAVVVSDDRRVLGVLSERDIIRRIAQNGAAALYMKVADAMTRNVVTTTPDATLDDGLEIMTDRRIRHLPVLASGKLAGIVSIGDLVKRKIASVEAEADAMKAYIHAG